MSHDQVRKLLGGYATNSLTESERAELFQAALNDQELFDALQQEEALKALLADPASRNQVQQALTRTEPSTPLWRLRAWRWGALAGAVAATVLIVAVIRLNQTPRYEVARVAPPAPTMPADQPRPSISPPAEPKPKALRSRTESRKAVNSISTGSLSADSEQPQAAAAPPPPPAAPPAAAEAPRLQAFREERFAPAGALLRYSVARRDGNGAYLATAADMPLAPGDAIRLNVFSAAEGHLSLDRMDRAGNWTRLFPDSGTDLKVAANASQSIPDSPIIVAEMEQKFRLTLVQLNQTPITLELTIGPGKVP